MAQGHIDQLNHQHIIGWAVRELKETGGETFVRVVMDGKELGTLRAGLFRPDLREAGISDGHSGYRFQFPEVPNPFVDHKIEVFERDSGTPLLPHPATLQSLVAASETSMLEFDSAMATTHIRTASFVDGVWHLSVELIGPEALTLKPSASNGTIESIVEDPPAKSPFIAAGLMRRTATVRIRGESGADMMFLELLADAAQAGASEPVCHIALPTRIPSYLNNVTHENMARVSGPNVTRDLFAATGVHTAFRIDAIVNHHFGKPLGHFDKIHDWGVGAGRVALPLKRMVAPQAQVSGSDVDAYNVDYAKLRYPDIEFALAPFYPPLPYKDGSFDALYGISVMTHLTEGAQFAWLKELRRVVKPGAPVILTVHGEYGIIDTAMRDPLVLVNAASRGISDHMYDMNLGPKLRDKKYYRATFHTRKYIAQEWTEYFEIVGYYCSGNELVEDFVVLKAK